MSWLKPKKKLQEYEDKIEPIRRRTRELEARLQELSGEISELKSASSELEKTFEEISTKRQKCIDTEDKENGNYNQFKKRIQDQQRRIEQKTRILAETKIKLENMRFDAEATDAEIKAKGEEVRRLDKEVEEKQISRTKIEERVRELRTDYQSRKAELQELDNVKKQRLMLLERKSPDSTAMYEWYQKNQHQFSRPIHFLPLEINIKEQLYAKYLELQCPDWLLRSFVCEDTEDRNKFTDEAKRQNKNEISVIAREKGSESELRRPRDLEDLKPYGFVCYLDQAFQAPQIIKDVMNDNSQLYKVGCGTELTLSKLDAIINNQVLDTFFTPKEQYTSRPSRYNSKDISSRVTPLREAKLFKAADFEKKREIESQLERLSQQIKEESDKIVEAQQGEQQAMNQREKARQTKLYLEKQKTEYNRLKMVIQQRERELEDEKKEENVEEKERIHKEKLRKINAEKIKYAVQLCGEIKQHVDKMYNIDIAHLRRAQVKRQHEDAVREERKYREEREDVVRRVRRLDAEVNEMKEKMRAKKEEATQARRNFQEKYPDAAIDELLYSLPDDLQTIEDEIKDEKEKAANIYHDPNILRMYEERKNQIAEMTRELDSMNRKLSTIDEDMKRKQEEWETPLRACVERIGQTFSTYCKHIGISGEVALVEDKEDYDKWEIQIRVKFRDKEELTTLSSVRQSGGERSVTTILYLLSLQTENKCPFRVVDEINQGMDPVNERKIFYQMLDSSRGHDIPQSFLITPKLLPDLVPNNANNITVLFIYNGPFNITQEAWEGWLRGFMPKEILNPDYNALANGTDRTVNEDEDHTEDDNIDDEE
jgi:chromosome segregation ATPase